MSIGKGMANGYALAANLGRREYMERGGIRHSQERVFFLSTTNGPEQSALAATLAVVEFYRQQDVIGHLYRTGQRLIDGLAKAAANHGIAEFISAASDFSCRPVLKFLGWTESPPWSTGPSFSRRWRRAMSLSVICPCFRHGESEVDQTLDVFDRACKVYAQALETGSVQRFLNGPAAKPVFRKFN